VDGDRMRVRQLRISTAYDAVMVRVKSDLNQEEFEAKKDYKSKRFVYGELEILYK